MKKIIEIIEKIKLRNKNSKMLSTKIYKQTYGKKMSHKKWKEKTYEPSLVTALFIIAVIVATSWFVSVVRNYIFSKSILDNIHQFLAFHLKADTFLNVLLVLGGAVFALLLFISESMRDSESSDASRVLLKESYLYPLTMVFLALAFIFLYGVSFSIEIIFSLFFAIFFIFSFTNILKLVLYKSKFYKKRELVLIDRLKSLTSLACNEIMGNELLLNMLEKDKNNKMLPLENGHVPREYSKYYYHFMAHKDGVISDINCNKLLQFISQVEDYYKNKNLINSKMRVKNNLMKKSESIQVESTDEYDFCLMSDIPNVEIKENTIYLIIKDDGLHYKIITPGGATVTDKITTDDLPDVLAIKDNDSMINKKADILNITSKRGHTLINSLNVEVGKSIILRKLFMEYVNKGESIISILTTLINNKQYQSLRQDFEDIFIITSDPGFSEDVELELSNFNDEFIFAVQNNQPTKIKLFGNTYLELFDCFLGEIKKYALNKQKYPSIRWLYDGISRLIKTSMNTTDLEIIKSTTYLPIRIARECIKNESLYIFSEFIELNNWLYLYAIEQDDGRIKEFLIDRSFRYITETYSGYLYDKNDKEYINVLFKINFQFLLKKSFDERDFLSFEKFLHATNSVPSRYADINKPTLQKLITARKEMLFGIASWILRIYYNEENDEQLLKSFWITISQNFAESFDELTRIFSNSLENEGRWGWIFWILEDIPEMTVTNNNFIYYLRDCYIVQALNLVKSLDVEKYQAYIFNNEGQIDALIQTCEKIESDKR
ncbi:MAG: hypothetical protein ACK4PR_08130, partial [Gammaproteobacteria bacterium]